MKKISCSTHKIAPLFLGATIFISLIFLFSSCSTNRSKTEKHLFNGSWIIDDSYGTFRLNADSGTCYYFSPYNTVEIKGYWELQDINVNNEKSTLLILKNELPVPSDPRESLIYYKYYFFSVEKIEDKKITIIALTDRGSDIRRLVLTKEQASP